MGGRSGAASVLDVQPLFLFIKQNWICVMTRIHAELNTNILLQEIFLLTLVSESEAIR